MLIWKLSNFLTHPEENAWKTLAQRHLPEDVHPNRRQGFLLARNALRMCFDSFSLKIPIEQLELDHFDQLKNHPEYTVSLSHTPQWGAALVASHKIYRSVGIDIEPVERVVKPAIFERVSHPEDAKFEALELWSLKEAAFKAVMNTRKFGKNIEFSSLQIHQDGWFHDKEFQGKWTLSHQNGLIIAMATLT